MRRLLALAAAAAMACSAASAAARGPFDPTADPAFDLARARAVAERTHRNLLLDVGGNWCVWCLVLDRALRDDPALKRQLAADYVTVHVNVSPDNPNMGFMARFPAATGYPFLIVLSPDGTKILRAQDGLAFQKGRTPREGYDHGSIAGFLARWRP
ncbi:MAG TPA: thioredoxin family protein [Allosphingosinicella sp.]|nr:thioredoxin family protein [Allosphingosinicella sp.]